MVKRNTTIPFRFNCVTDDAEGINENIRIIPLWDDCKDLINPSERHNKPSCYRRLKAFSEDTPFEDRIISIDLDCVIIGNIDDIINRTEDFICLKGTARNTPYNGGLWSLKVGSRPQVWEKFDPNLSPKLAKDAGYIGSDQGWISYVLGNKEKTFSDKDGVYCFREDFFKKKRKELPDNSKIVMFQGGHDPWEEDIMKKYPWVRKHYRLSTESINGFPLKLKSPKSKPINCITFYWGPGPYDAEYVNKLFNMVDRHLSVPHKNICFTNIPEGIREGIEIRPLHNEWMKGNLKKTIQFDPANNFEGRVFSFDLDNVIVGSLDVFAKFTDEFIIQEAIAEKRKGMCAGNFMAFEGGYGKNIWEELNKNYKKYEEETNGSERFFYDRLIKKMKFWPPGYIVSYKKDVKLRKVRNWDKVRIIWFHGAPKPHEIQTKRIINAWNVKI
jgi:hypothetical protein